MDVQINQYAPVIIPTLNRYEHFKRCLESLERCTGADDTDVYVGLDYPPSEKYIEGWREVDAYLSRKEKRNGFKNLFVRRRDHNCGACVTGSNADLLKQEVATVADRYIFSEDDNEFSPCFLQYMNKALERFYDDERVFLVCGYNFKMVFPKMYRNNFYFTKIGCPWGVGQWVHKSKEVNKYYREDTLRNILRNSSTYHLLMSRNPHSVLPIISMLKRHTLYGDAIKTLYSTLHDTYYIVPCESMVRNWGNDGTGEHSKRMNMKQHDYYITQSISEASEFEFTDDIFTYEPVYLKRYHYSEKFSLRRCYKDLLLKFDLFLLRHFNYLPESKYF